MARKLLILVIAIFIVLATVVFANRVKLKEAVFNLEKQGLPESVSYSEVKKKIAFVNGNIEMVEILPVEGNFTMPSPAGKSPEEEKKETPPPDAYNLEIPFTSQAPFGEWDEIHKEACEETSALMAARFINGAEILGPSDADKEILKLVEWQKINFGFWKDTDAEKTAEILRNYYGFKNTEVRHGVALDDIKREIAKGNPVIAPMAGRELGNPFYTPPGPFYHMLVIRGYTKDKIITNDPGTKRGESFVYDSGIFYDAMHDWNNGDVVNGGKAIIVVKK